MGAFAHFFHPLAVAPQVVLLHYLSFCLAVHQRVCLKNHSKYKQEVIAVDGCVHLLDYYMYVCVYIYAYKCMYMYIHINKHRHRHGLMATGTNWWLDWMILSAFPILMIL